jgi:feruloyl esterase
MRRVVFAALAVLALVVGASRAEAATCESLASLALPQTAVTAAESVVAGAFVPPGPPPSPAGRRLLAAAPAFCRVAATLTPTSDSDIKIEVWLPSPPAEGAPGGMAWNGKFQAVGNGGWLGSIPYVGLAEALAAGYATAATDTGHVGNTAEFALNPEKRIDFAYRAVHEMTARAKTIVDAYYGRAPSLSIWNGCSQGGRQGIAAAGRYPADFDAVIAGAPAVNYMHIHAGRMAVNRSVNATPEAVIPPAKYSLLHRAALAACDAQDGLADGVIENPAACTFEPHTLQCAGPDDGGCLTPAQVRSAQTMYAGAAHPATGARVLPGLAHGSELGWAVIGSPRPILFAVEAFKYLVHKDPAWDPLRFDPSLDLDRALAADPDDAIGSSNPNLGPFFARGGKLLLYHGWSDAQVTPYNTIDFFQKTVAGNAGSAGTSVQLFMVPGMNHCTGGPGTDTFDEVAAMESWIATGTVPARIEASHRTSGTVARTRPLCPFGQVARWDGRGRPDDASSFSCVSATLDAGR